MLNLSKSDALKTPNLGLCWVSALAPLRAAPKWSGSAVFVALPTSEKMPGQGWPSAYPAPGVETHDWKFLKFDAIWLLVWNISTFLGKKTWGKNTTQLGSEFHRRKRSSKNWGLCNLAGCPFNTVAAVPTSSTVFFSFTMNWWLIPTVWSQWHTNLTFSCNERYVCTVAGCIPNLIVPPQLHHHDCGNINILIIPHHKRTICWMFPACIFFPSSFGAQFFFIQPWTQITLNNSLFWTTWCPQH